MTATKTECKKWFVECGYCNEAIEIDGKDENHVLAEMQRLGIRKNELFGILCDQCAEQMAIHDVDKYDVNCVYCDE